MINKMTPFLTQEHKHTWVRPNVVWFIYFSFYLILNIADIYYFFSPASQMFWYYQILIAYHVFYIIPYSFNALSLILNTFTLLPLYGFIMKKPFLSRKFWGYFFIFRLAMDFCGKSYESKLLQALFYEDKHSAWICLGMVICWSLPSYIALFMLAFSRPKGISPKKVSSKGGHKD